MMSHRTATGPDRQRGAALITSLVLLVPISLVAVTGLQSRNLEQRMASNFQQHLQAQSLAESGLIHARSLLEQPCGTEDGFTDLLASTDPLVSTTNLGEGSFLVRIRDNDDGDANPAVDQDDIVILESIGAIDNLDVTVEQYIMHNGGSGSDYAILTEGDLTIGGNPSLNGCLVNVHANGDVVIQGGGQMAGSLSATGTIVEVVEGATTIDGGTTESADAIGVPSIVPSSLGSDATYNLAATGQIVDSESAVVWDGVGTDWNGWEFSAGDWRLTGDTPPGGVYYVDGSAVIDGNPGVTDSPWVATVIAEQNIVVNGDIQMKSFDSSLQIGDLRNLALVSGGDLQVNGASGQSFTGTLAAGEQIEVTGNPTIDGSLVAANDDTDSTLVSSNLISGDMLITNSLPDPDTGGVPVVPLAWRIVGN